MVIRILIVFNIYGVADLYVSFGCSVIAECNLVPELRSISFQIGDFCHRLVRPFELAYCLSAFISEDGAAAHLDRDAGGNVICCKVVIDNIYRALETSAAEIESLVI